MARERTTPQCYLLPLNIGKTSHNNTFNEPEHLELKFSRQSEHTNFHMLCFEFSSISTSSTSLRRLGALVFQTFPDRPGRLWTEFKQLQDLFFPMALWHCKTLAIANAKSNAFYMKEEQCFCLPPPPRQCVVFLKVKVRKIIFNLTYFQSF